MHLICVHHAKTSGRDNMRVRRRWCYINQRPIDNVKKMSNSIDMYPDVTV